MRRYLLDTSLVAALLNNRTTAVSLTTPWMQAHEVATSALVYAEVVEYIRPRSDFSPRQAALRTLMREVHPYFLTYRILERYAALRLQMRVSPGGGLIGDVDTLIAATALERDLTVVTTDNDFQRVPGLNVRLIARQELRRP